MSKRPVGEAPAKNNINRFGDFWSLAKVWQTHFERMRQNLYDIRDIKLTINPSNVGANTTDEQSFATESVESNDAILSVNKPSHTTGLGITNYRAGDNEIFIEFMNTTGSGIDAPEEDYLITILKR